MESGKSFLLDHPVHRDDRMKKKPTPKTRTVRCQCGGILRPVFLKQFDFTNWAGIPSRLEEVPALRCDTCEGETIPGAVINLTLHFMCMDMLRMPHRLPGECTKFLRRVLEVTQQELADRMGVVRETVAQWERGAAEISPQHDFILRTLFLSKEANERRALMVKNLDILEEMVSVRAEPPPRNLDFFPLVMAKKAYPKLIAPTGTPKAVVKHAN